MQPSFFNKLANVFDSGEKPVITEHQQADKNEFSSIIVDYVTGRRHQNYFEECEDYSGYRISDTRATIAVSDGCSSAKEARSAAKISVEYALAFFQDGDWMDYQEETERELITKFIDSLQKAFRISGKEYSQLCATLSIASFDKITNKYLLLSIGDGYVSAYVSGTNCRVVLPPFNRDGNPSRTCFGNSEDVVELTQIEIGDIVEKGYEGFVICSDGASSLYDLENLSHGKRILSSFADSARNSDETAVHEEILEIQCEKTYDDISVGIMMITPIDEMKTKISMLPEREFSEEDFNIEDIILDKKEGLADRFDLEKLDMPTQISTLILKNFEEYQELSIQELIDIGLCKAGKVLSTMMPFIREKILIYQDDKFVLPHWTED